MSPAERILDQCMQLAAISEKQDSACHLLARWMQQAGMQVWQDSAGNQWGGYPANPANNRPVVILGSHLDAQNAAGQYDGPLGVLCAIEVVSQLARQNVSLPFAIEVVGFGQETSQADSLAREPKRVLAYLELALEQGPILAQADQPVGIVNAIAAAKRFQFRLKGEAGHAGTVPMNMRRDPLCGAAQMIGAIEMAAWEHHVVATVGKLDTYPGAVNVIPGSAEFTLDLRAKDDQRLEEALKAMLLMARRIADARQLALDIELIHEADAVSCDPKLQIALASALEQQRHQPQTLLCGAAHDATMMSNLAPVGMLLVRSTKDASGKLAHSVQPKDVQAGQAALKQWLIELGNLEP